MPSFIWLELNWKVHREYKRRKIKPNAYRDLPIIRALWILWIRFFDDEGWPHYRVKEELPTLKQESNQC
jgi:hypothetical protein